MHETFGFKLEIYNYEGQKGNGKRHNDDVLKAKENHFAKEIIVMTC